MKIISRILILIMSFLIFINFIFAEEEYSTWIVGSDTIYDGVNNIDVYFFTNNLYATLENTAVKPKNANALVFNNTSESGQTYYDGSVSYVDLSKSNDDSVKAFIISNTLYIEFSKPLKLNKNNNHIFCFESNKSSANNKLTSISGLNYLDTSDAVTMEGMFSLNTSITSLDLSSWNKNRLQNVENMSDMFSGMSSLETLTLGEWDNIQVTDISYMFNGLSSITSITNLDKLNVSNVEKMSGVFSDSSFVNLDLSNWNVQNTIYMNNMFYGMDSLEILDLSNWNTSNVSNFSRMFMGDSELTTIYVDDSFIINTNNVEDIINGCSNLIGGNGTTYDSNTSTYARIDSVNNPGLFSVKYSIESEKYNSYLYENYISVENDLFDVTSEIEIEEGFNLIYDSTNYRLYVEYKDLYIKEWIIRGFHFDYYYHKEEIEDEGYYYDVNVVETYNETFNPNKMELVNLTASIEDGWIELLYDDTESLMLIRIYSNMSFEKQNYEFNKNDEKLNLYLTNSNPNKYLYGWNDIAISGYNEDIISVTMNENNNGFEVTPLARGTTSITITLPNERTSTCNITIKDPKVLFFEFDEENIVKNIDDEKFIPSFTIETQDLEEYSIKYTFYKDNNLTQELTETDNLLQDGEYLKIKKTGKVIVIANIYENNNNISFKKLDTFTLNIYSPLKGISIEVNGPIDFSGPIELKAKLNPTNTTDQVTYEWTTNNAEIIEISSSNTSNTFIRPVGFGTATVILKVNDFIATYDISVPISIDSYVSITGKATIDVQKKHM